MKITEARLNDFVYLTLKKLFFEAWGMNPRECDIRICMDLTCKERITSVQQAILSPNEVAGKSHDITYEVEPEAIFSECVDYMEGHWIKQQIPKKERRKMRKFFDDFVPCVMAVPEEQCGG